MKTARRLFPIAASLRLTILLGLSLILNTSAVQAFPDLASSSGRGQRIHKNPKLSTQIADLRRAVPQQHGAISAGEKVLPPSGFSVDKLPKSLRDAVAAGQMHITKDAEVQVYIQVSKVTEQNLQQLRSLGVAIQVLGSPTQKPGETGKLAGVPVVFNGVPNVQALVPVTMIEQVAKLPFVRHIPQVMRFPRKRRTSGLEKVVMAWFTQRG